MLVDQHHFVQYQLGHFKHRFPTSTEHNATADRVDLVSIPAWWYSGQIGDYGLNHVRGL
ncbi:hypothetical protein D3C86_1841460 [compost metagenome]